MQKINLRSWLASLSDIYNTRDENAKGRLITLICCLCTSFYEVFITGIFYTGFLSMYGMSITNVGIISFIPFIASSFSVFSPWMLSHFKRRKPVLLGAKIFFYALYILATTLMPQFVSDPDQRLLWFGIILFVAYSVYAMFSPGITAWFYTFYPVENERRTRYILINQIFASIMASAVLLISGVITDAVSGSPHQNEIILTFRYLAFVLVLVDVFIRALAREPQIPAGKRVRLTHVFTLPFKHKKLLLCFSMMFYWSFVANLNNGLWNYHLLNHMRFPYTLINLMSVMYTFILIFMSPFWRRILRRYSWIKTFGIANLLWVPTEVFFFLMTPDSAFLYVPLCTVQNLLTVGLNLSYANVLYMNLPDEDSTPYLSFQTIGSNVFSFLGLMTGTFISGITGDSTMQLLGLPIYSVQFTTLARGVAMLTLGLVLVKFWRHFTPDRDIALVDEQRKITATHRLMRRKVDKPALRLPWRKG